MRKRRYQTEFLKKFGEIFQLIQNLKGKTLEYNPVMEQSFKESSLITQAMEPLHQSFDELKS